MPSVRQPRDYMNVAIRQEAAVLKISLPTSRASFEQCKRDWPGGPVAFLGILVKLTAAEGVCKAWQKIPFDAGHCMLKMYQQVCLDLDIEAPAGAACVPCSSR